MHKHNTLKVAITGGIASGKSEAINYFQKKGNKVIDLDQISHNLTDKDPDIIQMISKLFGKEVIDDKGRVDRAKLGNIVFNNRTKLHELEKILHPVIRESMINQIKSCEDKIIFIEFQLLNKKDILCFFDHVILITSSKKKQTERIKNSRRKSEKYISDIIHNQSSNYDRRKLLENSSFDEIENNSSLSDFYYKLENVYSKLINF